MCKFVTFSLPSPLLLLKLPIKVLIVSPSPSSSASSSSLIFSTRKMDNRVRKCPLNSYFQVKLNSCICPGVKITLALTLTLFFRQQVLGPNWIFGRKSNYTCTSLHNCIIVSVLAILVITLIICPHKLSVFVKKISPSLSSQSSSCFCLSLFTCISSSVKCLYFRRLFL